MDCLIIGKVWPEPRSTAAGRRTLDLIRALRQAGWGIGMASPAQRNTHSFDLAALGVDTFPVRVNDSGFDDWIRGLAPQIVIFDRFMTEEQFGWRVEQACPDALRVLDTSDLHCLREARQQVVERRVALDLFNATALREIASIHRSDLTLMISEYEIALLKDVFAIPSNQIAYWPFVLEAKPTLPPSYDEREHFIQIGSFLHPPNLDAARWCKAVIWPHIRRALPSVELHLYGAYGEKYQSSLHDPANGFIFKGRANDALATMQQYRVNLVPLRYGAGLKGKIFDGFETGTPSCATPVGAEGIAGSGAWGGAASEDSGQFAERAVALYSDPEEWARVQAQGQSIVVERFDAAIWSPRLPPLLEAAYTARDQNRARNFTGRMLRHHQHRSTEFMSRWIEAKNA